jgi:hypothetical protein
MQHNSWTRWWSTFSTGLTLGLGIAVGVSLPGWIAPVAAQPDVHRVNGPFEVLGIDGRPILRVSDEPAEAALRSHARIVISRGTASNYVLQVLTAGGKYAASLGESSTGTGVVHLHDDGGRVRARADGTSGFVLFNGDGAVVGGLALGPKGGGALELMDPAGRKMVEAGAYQDGVGRVVVGPLFKCGVNPGGLGLGMPDCIKGRLK